MNRWIATLLLASASWWTPAAFAGDVGVSVSIGQPGFYGRIDVGRMPAPDVIYAQPVLVERVYAPPPPIYLRVPTGHYRHWKRHCHAYGACGRPVYFVREDWYARHYPRHYAPVGHGHPHYGPPPHVHRPSWDDRRDWDRHDRHDHHRGHGDWQRNDDRKDWHGHRGWDDRRDRDGRGDRGGWDGRGGDRRHHHER